MGYQARYENVSGLIPHGARLLDYGCGQGEFLQYVAPQIAAGVGVDLDREIVTLADRQNAHPHIKFICADARSRLPFEDDSFDVVTALGVLEHVGSEAPYVEEFYRVLRPRGRFLIDVPSKGPFRWLDVGNVKYNFPGLHRWYYIHIAREPEYYRHRFMEDSKMFGQFSREATQHKHYHAREIAQLLGSRFQFVEQFKYGLFFELIQFLEVLITKTFHVNGRRFFTMLIERDCRVPSFLASANMVVQATSRKGEQMASLASN